MVIEVDGKIYERVSEQDADDTCIEMSLLKYRILRAIYILENIGDDN